jgi:hypothetical protein
MAGDRNSGNTISARKATATNADDNGVVSVELSSIGSSTQKPLRVGSHGGVGGDARGSVDEADREGDLWDSMLGLRACARQTSSSIGRRKFHPATSTILECVATDILVVMLVKL